MSASALAARLALHGVGDEDGVIHWASMPRGRHLFGSTDPAVRHSEVLRVLELARANRGEEGCDLFLQVVC